MIIYGLQYVWLSSYIGIQITIIISLSETIARAGATKISEVASYS